MRDDICGAFSFAVTAQYLVSEYRNMQPGNYVLIPAWQVAVGQLQVQWLTLVATVSSEMKAAMVCRAAADAFINDGRSTLKGLTQTGGSMWN